MVISHTRSRLFFCFCDLDMEVYGEVDAIEYRLLFAVLRADHSDNGVEPLILLGPLDDGV